jgi:hypothetical protein
MVTTPDETVSVPEGAPLICTSSPSPTVGGAPSIHGCTAANGLSAEPCVVAAFSTDAIAPRARIAFSGSFGDFVGSGAGAPPLASEPAAPPPGAGSTPSVTVPPPHFHLGGRRSRVVRHALRHIGRRLVAGCGKRRLRHGECRDQKRPQRK